MKLKYRLMVGIGSLILLLLLLSGSGFNQMKRLNDNMKVIVNERYQKVELANSIPSEVGTISRDLSDLVLIDTSTDPTTYLNDLEKSNTKILTALSSLEGISHNEELNEVIQLKMAFDAYLEYQKQVVKLVQANRGEEAKNIILQDSKQKLALLMQRVDEVNTTQKQKMNETLAQSKEVLDRGVFIFALFILTGLVLGGGITTWLIRSITGNLGQLTKVIKSISFYENETTLPRLEVRSLNEIGEISEAFNNMVTALEQRARHEKEITRAIEEEHWLKSKVAETQALFLGVQDVKSFSRLLINWICQVVGASYGVIYVRQGKNGQQELVNMASYAGDGQEVGARKFRAGEGLVGQCLLENRVINITNIPDNYILINSGLGKIPPRHIIIFPIEFEVNVVAVIELASLSEFSPLEREFLERVRWNIGIVQNRISDHMQVQKLLTESQALTEELQTQSEELQMQQEELKTVNENIEQQYKNSEQKNVKSLEANVALEVLTHHLALNSQYKSEFLSNMSHELRTPLNSLLILSRMLADNRDGNLSLKQVEYAETILSSGNELLNLINEILDLSKIEAGKLQINPEPIALKELKDATEKQFYPIARQKGLDFTIQIERDLPETFNTDEHHLKQILKNLLSNAIKFTHQGNVVLHIQRPSKTTSPKLARVLESQDSLLAFSVTDTGIGIASGKQELIFEAFQQADGTTSRKYGGTGLGLSICKELASLLGGFIELESTEGRGSTFTLYLPVYLPVAASLEQLKGEAVEEVAAGVEASLVDRARSSKPEEAGCSKVAQSNSATGDLTSRRVLVVDDDMRNVFAITAALEALQIEVLFAENGQEALDSLRKNSGIDLVLMDIMMPEMDGYKAMQFIRQMPEYVNLPIIALTAKAMKGDREKCLKAGASDYISKPLEIDQLLSLIRVWLYR